MNSFWVRGLQKEKGPKQSLPSDPDDQSGKTASSRVMMTMAETRVSRTESSQEGCLEELSPEVFSEAGDSRAQGIPGRGGEHSRGT